MPPIHPKPIRINLEPGQSICLVFDADFERQQALGSFFLEGIERNLRVVWLEANRHDTGLIESLQSASRRPDQVQFGPMDEAIQACRAGERAFLAWLQGQCGQAQGDGFAGLCLAVEMQPFCREKKALEVLALERMLRDGMKDLPAMLVTAYDRRSLPADVIMHVLTAHPLVLKGGGLCRNPFHVPAAEGADREKAEWALTRWLDQLQARDQVRGPLPESEQRLRAIIASMPVVVFALNRSGIFTLSEGRGLENLGLAPGEVVGLSLREVYPDLVEAQTMLQRALQGDTFFIETVVNGVTWETWCSPLRNQVGEIDGMLGISMDITERRQAEKALRASEERYRMLVENQGEGAGIFAADGTVIYLNLAAEAIVGLPVEKMIGRNINDLIVPEEKETAREQLALRNSGQAASYEITIQRPDGKRRQVLVTATPRYDAEGNYVGSFSIFRDITERKRMEERLRFQSSHDALTGLHNRFYFDDELRHMDRNRTYPAAVIVVDIDNMKVTNDNYGHLAGDALLRRVARLLRSSFRSEDVVARIGGDEFAVLLPDSDQNALDHSMERLRRNLEKVNEQSGQEPLVISIGGAAAEVGQSLLTAFDLADQRMYREKYARKQKD